MTKKFKLIILNVILLSMIMSFMPLTADFGAVNAVKAQDWLETVKQGGLDQVAPAFGVSEEPKDIRMMAADIIKIVLGFLGIIFLVLIIYAGFRWMTAGGNEENVAAAKKLLTNSVIGLIIVIAAYAMANFVIAKLVESVNNQTK